MMISYYGIWGTKDKKIFQIVDFEFCLEYEEKKFPYIMYFYSHKGSKN